MFALFEITMSRLEPRLRICSATRAWAPSPTATIAISEATPMMTPSIVSALGILFGRRARAALLAFSRIMLLPQPGAPGGRAGSPSRPVHFGLLQCVDAGPGHLASLTGARRRDGHGPAPH